MEGVRTFLESSTIHGLGYISISRKYVRLFWSIVVMAGFTGAGILIYQSFQSWEESPVKTTIETRPIEEMTFPKVTVCPPKNTYTDLNYDLVMTKNKTINETIRNELTYYALELLNDNLHNTIMKNLSMLHEDNRFHNWYHGYTQVVVPYVDDKFALDGDTPYTSVMYDVATSAVSGTISTQYFGDKFDADKVETYLLYRILLQRPENTISDTNVTLHIDFERISMKNLASDSVTMVGDDYENGDESHIVKKISNVQPGKFVWVALIRRATLDEIKNQKLESMPGFRCKWRFMGMSQLETFNNTAFIRNNSNKTKMLYI